MSKSALIIVAAGRGSRAGFAADAPKQYRVLAGRAVLARTLDAFAAHPRIGDIQVVIHADDRALYDAVAGEYAQRLMPAVIGGATRQASVRAGLEALETAAPERVLIHDAARPFVTAELIAGVLDALARHGGAVPGLAVSDTLKRAGASELTVAETIPRDGLYRAQTPQGFQFAGILEAHRSAAAAGREDFTDDAAIAEWAGLSVAITPGSAANIKLTTAEDLARAEKEVAMNTWGEIADVRVGTGFDVHAFGPGNHVMLCGVRIPHDRALAGHSDADVGMHALTDALLGAIGAGDIGTHFPPSDPQWEGASSDLFLRDAVERISALGGMIAHADVTLVCEAPRIGPHATAMRARLATLLDSEPERVSVKATTSERLGFTGRGEGIAALATATVRLPVRL